MTEEITTIPAPVYTEFGITEVNSILNSKLVDQDLVDDMNKIVASDELADSFRNNLITYTKVLEEGTYSPSQYVKAVQYVSYRLMGHDSKPSWEKTFPDRYARLLKKGASDSAISSHASAYNRTKLVAAITKQSLIPSYIVNNGYFQKALDKQLKIMDDPKASLKVQSDAAHRVMEYTAMPPELAQESQELSKQGMDIIQQLAAGVQALAESKRDANRSGDMSVEAAARKPIYTIDKNGDKVDG